MKRRYLITVYIFYLLTFLLFPAFSDQIKYNTYYIGIASWYGGGEKLNKYTANGDIFNPKELTCASWYYPFNTTLKVTNLSTGDFVIVRVNDRGPNKRLGRLIDLTKSAFNQIADINIGLIQVRVEIV